MGSTAGSLEREARDLVERLGGHWSPGGALVSCPAHADRTPSLSIRPGARRLLFHCFAGCTVHDVLCALNAHGHLRPSGAPAHPGPLPSPAIGSARRLWEEARPLEGSPAEAYLRSRGLIGRPDDLRFHARAPFGRAPLTRFEPALLAAIRDGRGLVAVQRTLIGRLPGPAPESVRRANLGRLGKGAVRLAEPAGRLGLAEGVETALSVHLLFGWPCWATLGSERFGQVEIPTTVRELGLFLDHDDGGRRAEALARKAFGHLVTIVVHHPSRPGADWNDVLRSWRATGGDGSDGRDRGGKEAGGR